LFAISKNQIRPAVADIREGLQRNWMWIALAMQDIKMRYRGSILGPFWLTISTLVMIAAIGSIYPRILHIPASDYLPYLATGLVIWSLLASLINEGCSTFLSVQHIIRQVRLPFSLHAFHSVFRNLVVFAHSFIVIPLVIIIFSVPITWTIIWIVPGMMLITINGVWLSILLGMASARFRDIPPIVNSFVTVAFFATPVFWHPQSLGVERWVVDYNPLFAALDVIRAPILGVTPSPYSWPVLLVTTAVGSVFTFLFFARWRARISYWAN
jgi:homopolymeric O-antigen transport system permease protein